MGIKKEYPADKKIMKSLILTLLRYLSLPLAILYGVVVAIRNLFYDRGIFSSIEFSLPVICVGNLSVGGTGKSPHIEYLIERLQHKYHLATLSRGYKRYTRGFKLATLESNARDIGDEPFQFKSKFPQVEVCVAEERMTAIPQLLQRRPFIDIILLDDAFQHRTVKAGLNILLTDYHRPYIRDHIMPFGLLRESRKAARRAEIIVVTKCPADLSDEEQQHITQQLEPASGQSVYFSCIEYRNLSPLWETPAAIQPDTVVLLVTGIANPEPLKEKLQQSFKKVYTLSYADHHYFTADDAEEISETFQQIPEQHKIIVTTEKDAARLQLRKEQLIASNLPVYVQYIGIRFLNQAAASFDQRIMTFIHSMIPEYIDIGIESEDENKLIDSF